MEVERVHELSTYRDWLAKAEHELRRYQETHDVYDLANTFLTLNALPEWIAKTAGVSQRLRSTADAKLRIMKGEGFKLDESRLDELDHQLRLVRLFCNHAKHSDSKAEFDRISMCTRFPATFPIRFDHLQVGSQTVEAVPIVKAVVHFWSREICR
jgi:hypothetical protein